MALNATAAPTHANKVVHEMGDLAEMPHHSGPPKPSAVPKPT
jgi:hypothetical protein